MAQTGLPATAAALVAGSSLAMAQAGGGAGTSGGANVQQHNSGGAGVNAGAHGNVGARGATTERGGQGMGREERGEHILHRTGHGMGVQGHEYPDDMPFCQRPLIAGEVYSVEPGIYVYGLGGFRLDDTVVIGAMPEVITQAPRDLKSNTIL